MKIDNKAFRLAVMIIEHQKLLKKREDKKIPIIDFYNQAKREVFVSVLGVLTEDEFKKWSARVKAVLPDARQYLNEESEAKEQLAELKRSDFVAGAVQNEMFHRNRLQ